MTVAKHSHKSEGIIMAETLNPYYYSIDDTVNVPGINSELGDLTGASVSSFFAALTAKINYVINSRSSGGNKKLNLLINYVGDVVSTPASQTIELDYDPFTNELSVGGVILSGTVDFLGTAAVGTVISLLARGSIIAVGAVGGIAVGAVGGGVALVVGGAAVTSLLWSAIKASTELDDDIFNRIFGTTPVNIQIVDQNDKVTGGALFKDGLSEGQELEAIQKLLERTLFINYEGSKNEQKLENEELEALEEFLGRELLSSFPDISIGSDRIRVVEKTSLSPRQKEYKVYDGKFVDVISQELGIPKEELLGLGQVNSPNTNAQIYYKSSTFNPKSFVFASDENRFFVPLSNTTGEVSPVGLNPSNIISGSSGNDTLDAFLNRDRALGPIEKNLLYLGLEGDDIINGYSEDNIIAGGEGNDTIDGGPGEDIVIFSDLFENHDYSISEDGTITFSHTRGTLKDGVDKLKNVEFARFLDKTVALPLVALPLGAETPLNSERPKGDVTFRFKTTVAERGKNGNLNLGAAIPLVLEYSFDPKMPDLNGAMDGRYYPINGMW